MSPRDGHIQGVRVLALAALAGLPACSMLAPNRAVALSTNPPGATVKVDGRNSGFVTPCQIQLDIDEDVRLDFEVPGFRPETRYLTPDDAVYSILWTEMYVGPQTWHFPLWLPFGDILAPVKWTEGHAPGRVHVDLDRLADEEQAVRTKAAARASSEATPEPDPAAAPADRPQ
jgi:hypothetical protein